MMISLILGTLTIPLTIGGFFNYNMIVHQHLMQIFGHLGDGALGIFFLVCYVHDAIAIFVILYLTTYLAGRFKKLAKIHCDDKARDI